MSVLESFQEPAEFVRASPDLQNTEGIIPEGRPESIKSTCMEKLYFYVGGPKFLAGSGVFCMDLGNS